MTLPSTPFQSLAKVIIVAFQEDVMPVESVPTTFRYLFFQFILILWFFFYCQKNFMLFSNNLHHLVTPSSPDFFINACKSSHDLWSHYLFGSKWGWHLRKRCCRPLSFKWRRRLQSESSPKVTAQRNVRLRNLRYRARKKTGRRCLYSTIMIHCSF